MKYNYAKLEEDVYGNNVCVGISGSTNEVFDNTYLQIPKYDTSIIGKVRSGSKWIADPNKEEKTIVIGEI